jgi:hypothetical protein
MPTADQFSDLAPYVAKWGKPGLMERVFIRCESTFEELKEFHAATLPHLEDLIAFLDQWPLDDIPAEHLPLKYTALAMCEVDNSVNRWKAVMLPDAQDPRTVVFKNDYFDMEIKPQVAASAL